MSISRRDFMKLVGVSVASLALTRCRFIPATCYAPMPPSPYPTEPVSARDRLRACWLRFDELVQKTQEESAQGVTENTFGQQLVAEHRLALDELASAGKLTTAVADLIQEAYDAAVYHVWRSNASMTCYEPMIVDYAPISAGVLVQQASVLSDIADENSIDPATLEKARAALEHDMAYYALTDEEVDSLYEHIINEWQTMQQTAPAFEEVDLEVTPDAKTAAQFIIDLLTGK
jgi:hypothetical protein